MNKHRLAESRAAAASPPISIRSRPRRFLVAAVAVGVALCLQQDMAAAGAATSIWGQASPSGFPVGTSIFDTINLGQGQNPTGTITFTLFAPGNVTCAGSPLFTSTKPVAGNGYYESARYASTQVGTYGWIARYNGDAANNPAVTKCNEPSQAVSVGKRTVSLLGTASVLAGGATLADTATLGATLGATGTLSFAAYGPDDMVCGTPPAFTSAKAVAGNATYASGSFTPLKSGAYRWVASYSGDANHVSARTMCADPTQMVVAVVVTQTARFVNQAYSDLLGRAPSADERTSWVSKLDKGTDRTAFAAALTMSNEFWGRRINEHYVNFLGRQADAGGKDAFVARLAGGESLEVVPTTLGGSDEYYKYTGGTPTRFVDALYGDALAVAPDPGGRGYWIDLVKDGSPRVDVAEAFVGSRHAHANLLDAAYPWLLRRSPDASGRTFWLDHLDDGLRAEHLYAYFVGSPEYWSRV